MASPPALDPATVAERTGSAYPAPLDEPWRRRGKRALGNQVGLTHFGVNLTRIEPGAWSAQRHWHTRQDGDEVHYPDVDLFVSSDFVVRHKNGEPY
jgi:uncharacterized cupin superfamily protein